MEGDADDGADQREGKERIDEDHSAKVWVTFLATFRCFPYTIQQHKTEDEGKQQEDAEDEEPSADSGCPRRDHLVSPHHHIDAGSHSTTCETKVHQGKHGGVDDSCLGCPWGALPGGHDRNPVFCLA